MSDAEVALELLKLALEKCGEMRTDAAKKETFLQMYRDCLAAVQKADRA